MSIEFSSAVTKEAPYGRAVVIGGSIAGLTAARVLSDHFKTVTVIERSTLANGFDFPQGAPQARHPHLLLIRGERILEGLFPGFGQNLLDGGAQRLNFGRDLRMRVPDGWLPNYETEMAAIATSRRLLDHTVYQRVAENAKVTFKPHSEVMSICTDEANKRAIGVQIRNRVTGLVEDVPAEFVVDASGRSSKAPEWLAQLGFDPPEEQTVNAFPGYTTRIYEIPKGFDQNWKTLYIMPNPPHVTRGAIIVPMEGNLWHVSLIGMNRDYPPTDEKGFMAFARSLVSPEVYEAIKEAKPASPIWGYRRAENRMRRFDALDRYLEGFVALGDAVYALNPVYGQGMTLAAIASQLLDQCLAAQAQKTLLNDFTGLAEKFQKALQKELVIPWQTATNEDMRWSDTTGKRELDVASKVIGRYFKMVLAAMPHSVNVTSAFFHVQHMIAPPTILMRPRIVADVVKANLSLRLAK
ncbi:MAG: FAD-dependent monooxygenase [Anaerolineales bacterium]|nr:FAD-dependent monooxygenase [Anaerolineales bacterium]